MKTNLQSSTHELIRQNIELFLNRISFRDETDLWKLYCAIGIQVEFLLEIAAYSIRY